MPQQMPEHTCSRYRPPHQHLFSAPRLPRPTPPPAVVSAQGKIKSLEQIYLFSMPVKEYQIVEYFLGSALKDEVMKIMPVQKQTRAGQRTRFKVRTPRAKWCNALAAAAFSVLLLLQEQLLQMLFLLLHALSSTRRRLWSSATPMATSASASSVPRR